MRTSARRAVLIHKSTITMLVLAVIAIVAVFMGGHLPSGFLPQEDQGYLFAALQLPDASSMQRTDVAVQKVTKALLNTPGVGGVVGVDGFNLLTLTQSTNTGFFFVSLKPWEQRKSKEEQIQEIQASVQRQLMGISDGLAFSFPPPQIPGVGTSGRRHHDPPGSVRQRRSHVPHKKSLRISRRTPQAA